MAIGPQLGTGDGGPTRVEQAISVVRSAALVMLLLTFCAAFAFGVWAHVRYGSPMVISAGEFIGVLTAVVVWFFKARDDDARRKVGGEASQ